jgi:hypothetical protein
MIDREKVYEHCIQLIRANIDELKDRLLELKQSLEGESKSSAGDKHETSRAMLHLEQEKLGNQLNEKEHQQAALEPCMHYITSKKINKGSLIHTNNGYIYLAVALGKIRVAETDVMVISPVSPLGMLLAGKKINEEVTIHDKTFLVIEVD